MNREIKFRAWDYQNNKWATNRDVSDSVGLVFDIKDYFINIAGERALRFVFQQYTGLKDKNGKDIYEGDIVVHGKAKVKSEIIFEDGSFAVSTNSKVCLRHHGMEEFEVIGNAYETKELIEN